MACPEWLRKDMKKTGVTNTGPKTKANIRDMGSLFHKKEVKGYADGGEIEAMKQEGLKASAGEKVGFFERLRAGNIDDPNSEAYRRWGAGRGQAERQEAMKDAAMAEAFKNAADRSPPRTAEQDAQNDKDTAYESAYRPSRPKPVPVARSADADAQPGGFYGRTPKQQSAAEEKGRDMEGSSQAAPSSKPVRIGRDYKPVKNTPKRRTRGGVIE